MSVTTANRTESREPATVRVAMWSSRHRWPVAAGWFVATIGLFVLSQAIGGIKADDPNGNPNQAQTESAKAYSVFDAGGTQHADRGRHDRHHAPEPQGHRPGLPDLRRRGREPPEGTDSRRRRRRPSRSSTRYRIRRPPRRQPGSCRPTGPRSGSPARSPATRRQSSATSCPSAPAIAAIEANGSGFTVHSVSQTLTSQDITNLINSGLDRTFITIGLTFIILLITFGAFVASIVPLVLAVTALLAAFGILGIFSQLVIAGEPLRDPAGRPDRPGRLGRLLAVHDHAVPVRATARAATSCWPIEVGQQHGRPGGVLQRSRGHDLDRRAVPDRRLDLPLDGHRDDRRDLRRRHRQPDVPAGDAGDPG